MNQCCGAHFLGTKPTLSLTLLKIILNMVYKITFVVNEHQNKLEMGFWKHTLLILSSVFCKNQEQHLTPPQYYLYYNKYNYANTLFSQISHPFFWYLVKFLKMMSFFSTFNVLGLSEPNNQFWLEKLIYCIK